MALKQQNYDLIASAKSQLSNANIGWSQKARESALSRLINIGLPSHRDEYWKYTDPAELLTESLNVSSVEGLEHANVFSEIEVLKIVFCDGVFSPELSDDFSSENMSISKLSDTGHLHWAQNYYGNLEKQGQSPVSRPLAALNTATATDGILLHVKGKIRKPVLILGVQNTSCEAVLHHVIKVDKDCSLTLLESGPFATKLNTVMEVFLEQGANFEHVRTQGRDHNRWAATHIFSDIQENAKFKSFTLTANGVLTRNECVLNLSGNDCAAHVAGASVGDGNKFHHDDTVFITHDAVACESRQVFKKVLRNGATGVFQGKILVKEGAQKTDGYQISQSLLLDDDSQFLAKPELEIYADDVVCSHGSTSGAIDEQALFYLCSRGISRKDATDMLTLAFLAEAVEEIENENVAKIIVEKISAWLSRRKN
ncbi:SufD family Fe-S cluster assembly protein [Paracoccaceae bacterium]|nr:SufD family Fe-S cluster assembly protein [Paracoccaceae bacterium]